MGFTYDTEVLTVSGWKQIDQITNDDNLAVLVNGQELQYKPVLKVDQEDFEGEVVKVLTNDIEIETTADHHLYVATQQVTVNKETGDIIQPKKLESIDEGDETKSDSSEEVKEEVDQEAKCEPKEEADQEVKEEPKEEVGETEVKTLLIFQNNSVIETDGYESDSIQTAVEYIIEHSRIPTEFILNFSRQQSAYLIEMIFQGSESILTESRGFANDLSVIALNAGIPTCVHVDDIVIEEDTEETKKGTYTAISIIKNTNPIASEYNISRSNYSGPIYNIKTLSDKNIIYIRRNGKPVWIYGHSEE